MGPQLPAAGASLPPPPAPGSRRPGPGGGVPRRRAAWRIALRPPFRPRLRLRRLQGASLPRLRGRKAGSRPGPGRARGPSPDGGRRHAPGSGKAPKPAGPSGLRAPGPAGAVAAPSADAAGRAGGAPGRHKAGSRVLRALCRLHKAAPEPAPRGQPRGAPPRAGVPLPHSCTPARRAPRPGGPRTPAPTVGPREQRGNLSPNDEPSP